MYKLAFNAKLIILDCFCQWKEKQEAAEPDSVDV